MTVTEVFFGGGVLSILFFLIFKTLLPALAATTTWH